MNKNIEYPFKFNNLVFTGSNIYTSDITKSPADAIVVPVNCVGVMGAGLAKEFKKLYPKMYEWYVYICHKRELKMGKVAVYRAINGKILILFPTKNHWRDISHKNDIIDGLWALRWIVEKIPSIKTIAVPKLGCGRGKLKWALVSELIKNVLLDSDATWFIYGEYLHKNK